MLKLTAIVVLAFIAPATAGAQMVGVRGATPTKVGAEALNKFTPALASVDGAFECSQPSTDGIVTVYVANFPTNADSRASLAVTVDSTGRITRYSERRGPRINPDVQPGMAAQQRASAMRLAVDTVRATFIQFDYARNQIMARNSGGEGPNEMVIAPIAGFENSDSLGRPAEKATRVLAACVNPK